MPMDSILNYSHGSFCWSESFIWFPKRCVVTNKLVWLTKGMIGYRMITGPGEPVIINICMNKDQFLLEQIKGKIK